MIASVSSLKTARETETTFVLAGLILRPARSADPKRFSSIVGPAAVRFRAGSQYYNAPSATQAGLAARLPPIVFHPPVVSIHGSACGQPANPNHRGPPAALVGVATVVGRGSGESLPAAR
ncbi:MAG: hypothetical protein EBY17_28185 [Acidobacteriia bacterium]|nr:hypothetical protein [Terriglobia bacterium]